MDWSFTSVDGVVNNSYVIIACEILLLHNVFLPRVVFLGGNSSV